MKYQGEDGGQAADAATSGPPPDFSRRAQPLRDIRKILTPGDVMDAFTLCQVIDSNGTDLADGTIVLCMAGWQEYAAIPADWARPIEVRTSLTHHIGVLGITGLTGYFGMLHVGKPQAGETVVVSSAAGGVGTVVGQLAKIAGARVVGLTRSDEKNRVLERDLGFDATVNYGKGSFANDLRAACPEGVDVYYDSVGGQVLETVLNAMNDHGRVACCGIVSQYDQSVSVGPANLPTVLVVKRVTMTGFTVTDFIDLWPQAESDMSEWIKSGQLKVMEEVIDGLENAPRALVGLMAGENVGKRTIRVAPDPEGLT